MRGTEELAGKVNQWLLKWRKHTEATTVPGDMTTAPGMGREDFLVHTSCPRFGNGEGKGLIKDSVRGLDLYILCDVGAYNCTYDMYGQKVPMSPDDHYMDLKRTIAAVGGKAKRITVIMPMLYGGRQHRRTSRESLDCALMLQELERMGVNNLITFDAHDPRVQNAVPEGGFESVMPSYQIFKALLRKEKTLQLDKEHLMIVSPDEGALDRNIFYASVLGVDMGMFYKRRDYTRIVNGRNPIVAHEYMGNDLDGKDVFVADDILSSGESIIDVARNLKKRNANRIFAAVTFPLFTNGLELYNKAYEEGLIDGVISTNLTYRTPELQAAPWFIEADMSKYISYIIATLNHDRSLSKLLSPSDRIAALKERYEQEQVQNGIKLV
ncbi:MAG: ribose-phosphate pyrophosphokinase [Clostridia bacterium]|nr:ribose-phosphate pyrophosphokinase [Clostridia bacterium]